VGEGEPVAGAVDEEKDEEELEQLALPFPNAREIGRASCRERVYENV
jgi:hypothetical protein